MTNKIQLRTVDEYNSGYTPVYSPIWGLFMGNAVKYTMEVGTQTLREVKTVGDIRAKRVTPKDTEIKQISVAEGSKTFKKFPDMNQFVQSSFQDQQGVEDVIAQVLDEHQKQADEKLLGDGFNSGIYTSTDANYLSQGSYEVLKGTTEDHVADLYKKVIEQVEVASINAGRKLLMIYGSTAVAKYSALFQNVSKPFSAVLNEGLANRNTTVALMPSDITPNANGFLVCNLDQIKLHWTEMPQLLGRGVNEEKNYYWFNFLLGSMMADLRVNKAIVKQPLTFQA